MSDGAKRGNTWVAVAAIGSLLGGVAAVLALFYSHATPMPTPAPQSRASPYYVDACEQRANAINQRAALRHAAGEFAMTSNTPAGWCRCTGDVLNTQFEPEVSRRVGDWFQAVALGGAEMSAEEEYFSHMSSADRRLLEGAYDFAARQCAAMAGQ